MKRILVTMLLASSVLMTGCRTGCPRQDVKVGSYNIRLQYGDQNTPNAWDARKEAVLDLIVKMDLDVLGLQEVCLGQIDFLMARLPQYAKVGVHREDGKRQGEAAPVLYRKDRFTAVKDGTFWLSETPEVPGSKSWGTACTRLCSWVLLKDRKNGRTFCFANTHTDHRSELARKEGMLLIIQRMRDFAPPGTPIVFTGDHNCRETEAPALAVSKLLKNAMLISETPPTGSWRTYNGWQWHEKETLTTEALAATPEARNAVKMENAKRAYVFGGTRIDYIYVSEGIRVKAFATRNEARPGTKLYPSDHFPVTAVLNW